MTPLEIALLAALSSLAGFVAWFLRWAIAHLESDLAYSRRSNVRSAHLAERATDVAEQNG